MTPEEIDRLFDEMKEIRHAEPMRASEIAELIIEQSAAIGYDRHIPYAHDIHARRHAWEGRNEEASTEFDLAIRLAQEAGDRKIEQLAMNDRGCIALDTGQYAQAKDYLSKAIQIARESGDRASEALSHYSLGGVHSQLGDYSEALRVSERGLALAEETGDKYSSYLLLNQIGIIHTDLADYSRALEFYSRCLAYAEETGNKDHIASALGNIGMVQGRYGDHPRALEYFARALGLFEEIGGKRGIAIALCNVGSSYQSSGDFSRSLEYHKRALELCEKIGDRRSVGILMDNIAKDEFLLGNLDIAYRGFLDSLHYQRDVLKSNEKVSDTLHALGSVLIEQGKIDEGLLRLKEALALAEEMNEKLSASELHKDIAEAYSKKGDMARAYEHITRHAVFDKEIFSEESKKSMEKFNMRVAIAEQEGKTEIEKMKREQTERELANTTLQLVAHTNRLAEFRDSIREIAAKMPPSEATVRELRAKVKDLAAKAVDWKKYDEQFKAAYPEFSAMLMERYPKLSPTELRVCALM
ncbi:MAG: tetratricopeptide repeat protein, partial [Candidatus Kapaibacterium sp.]